MKQRPLIVSLTLSAMLAALTPLSAFAANHGFVYQNKCGSASTGYITTSCPGDGITGNTVLQVSIPACAGPNVNGGADIQIIGPGLPKKGIGFQSLAVKADLGKVDDCDVWAVISFTSGPAVVVPFSDFSSNCSKGCLETFTITSADLPGTGSRIVNRIRLLARGSNNYCPESVIFGNVNLTQYFSSGLNANVFTTPVGNSCNILRPPSCNDPT
jgi:hypothetical protein